MVYGEFKDKTLLYINVTHVFGDRLQLINLKGNITH